MEKYFGAFGSVKDVEQTWAGEGVLSGAVVIVAIYAMGDYEGDAMIVFRKDGKLFEAHCSHCSCNGLDRWFPEETTYEALVDRLDKTRRYQIERFGDLFVDALHRGLVDEMFDREVLGNAHVV